MKKSLKNNTLIDVMTLCIEEEMESIWQDCDDPRDYDGYYDSNPYGVEDHLIGSSSGWQYPDDDTRLQEEAIENLKDCMDNIYERLGIVENDETTEMIYKLLDGM